MLTLQMNEVLIMREQLLHGIVLVHIVYKDGTEFCFRTTLNVQELSKRGITLRENALPCLDKVYIHSKLREYKNIPLDNIVLFEIVDKPVFLDKKAEKLSAFL